MLAIGNAGISITKQYDHVTSHLQLYYLAMEILALPIVIVKQGLPVILKNTVKVNIEWNIATVKSFCD